MGIGTKLKSRVLALLLVTPMIGLSACLPESKHPISDPATAVVDQRLTGFWFGGPPDEPNDHYLAIFMPQDEMSTDVTTVKFDDDGGEWIRFSMTTSTVGGYTYMNILYQDQSDDDEFFENYLLCYYFIDESNRLQIWTLSNEEIEKAIEEGLPGEVTPASWVNDVKITATSDELQEFLLDRDPKTLFTEPVGIYKKDEDPLIGVVKAETETETETDAGAD